MTEEDQQRKKKHHRSRSRSRSPSCSDRETKCIEVQRFRWGIIKGEKGDKGDKGDQGPKGEKGDRGRPGHEGPRGECGIRGPDGDRGHQGECGASGPRGERGPHGPHGPAGPQGERGHCGDRGERGDTGHGGILGYAYASSNITQTLAGSLLFPVTWNVTDYHAFGVTVSGSTITLKNAGTYAFDWSILGSSADPTQALNFSLLSNGTTAVPGSNFVSSQATGLNSTLQSLSASCLVTVPNPLHGINTGAGTTISLINTGTTTVTLPVSPLNASIRILQVA